MNLFLLAIIVLVIFMSLVFGLAIAVRDNSIVDIAYGLAFLVVGWSGYLAYGSGHARQFLVLVLVTIWGLRLAAHISVRKLGEEGEDFRYRQWREAWGKSFLWRSFLQIFMLQGTVIYLVALPVLVIINQPGGELGWRDLVGTLLWLIGFTFETVGDWQLLRFKANPANKGRIIQTGLWSYTRHPNYFGEATLWWGILLIALGSPHGVIAIISPVLIGFLLLKVSGVPLLEERFAGNPEFESYKERTNKFFPWCPTKGDDGD